MARSPAIGDTSLAGRHVRRRNRAEVLAQLIVGAVLHTRSVETGNDLARLAGQCKRTLQRDCQSVGTNLKSVLDVVMCARALIRVGGKAPTPESLFPDLDPRTARRLTNRAGLLAGMTIRAYLGSSQHGVPPEVAEQLRQHFECARTSASVTFLVAILVRVMFGACGARV